MILFPAIDIRNGNCVRLIQGDYDQETIYGDSPREMALEWEKKGAEYLHLVDLDGAKTGNSLNQQAIKKVAEAVSIPVQVGGGIRSMDIIEQHIASGVSRVIIGTAAINTPTFLKEAVATYGDKIAVSIDARNGYVATDGWTETSDVKAIDLIKTLEEVGVQTIVYTDIHKDGMLEGPNFEELRAMDHATFMHVIASGGVTTKGDILKLKAMDMYGAIIGKALYDGNLVFEELVETTPPWMKNKKIISCMDIDSNGRVVKGKKFKGMKDISDPLALAKKYSEVGVDELVFYDITASTEDRSIFLEVIEKIAKEVDVPFTVGGGIQTLEDMQTLFDVGVDKVSINSAAIKNPLIIQEASQKFGAERIMLSMDVKQVGESEWSIFKRGGQTDTGLKAVDWATQAARFGAGEIVINSIDSDGEKNGYHIELTRTIANAVNIPVIASGGAGTMEHFREVLTEGQAAGALAASVFHYDEIDIADLKTYLAEQNPQVRNDN